MSDERDTTPRKITFALPQWERDEFDALAAREGRSRNNLIVHLCRQYLATHHRKTSEQKGDGEAHG